MACSAQTAAKYSAVLSGVFWQIVCVEEKKKTVLNSENVSSLLYSFQYAKNVSMLGHLHI